MPHSYRISSSLLVLALLVACVQMSAQTQPAILVNAGGPSLTTPDGKTWSADRNFSGGRTYSTTSAIGGTTTPVLYQTGRSDNAVIRYSFPVVDAAYDVTLKFAETVYTTAGKRAFHVNLNGQRMLTEFEPFAAAGGALLAVDRKATLPVSGGTLVIEFVPVLDKAIISAIEIVPTQGGRAPTVGIAVSPVSATLRALETQLFTAAVSGTTNQTVTWSISPAMGSVSAGGLYTAPATVSSPQTVTLTATSAADPTKSASAVITLLPPVAVSVAPGGATLQAAQTQQFTATVTWAMNTAVTWSISPMVGTVTSGGLYTAPATVSVQQAVTVTATSVADATKKASAVVTLMPPVAVSVSPGSVSLQQSQTQQFTASVTGTVNTAVTWSISPSVGTVSASGLYTAPATINSQQAVTVTATSVADTSKSATATVTLAPPVMVSVSPATASLQASQTQQFTASVTGTANTAVTWSVSPSVGTVSASGLYTAPATISSQQTVTVRATSVADTSKSATATVTLAPPVMVSVSPATASLQASQTQQFTATVTGTVNTAVTWSLQPQVGTISTSGPTAVYTSPSAISQNQTVNIVATSVADSTVKAIAVLSLMASGGGAQTLIQTFTLKEQFGVNHPRQVVEMDFGQTIDPSQSFMLGPDGQEVPFQVLSTGQIAFETYLGANTERSFKLYSGRPPATFTDTVKLTTGNGYYEITNGLTGVRVVKPEGLIRTVPISTVSVSSGVAIVSTTQDHYLETVLDNTPMPTAKLPVTLSGIEGACSYLNGKSFLVSEASTSVWQPSKQQVKINNVGGTNCSSNGGQLILSETTLAPIQGLKLRDETWAAAETSRLTWLDSYTPFNARVLNAKDVRTRVVENGPIKSTLEVAYYYNRPARTFNEQRACSTLGYPTTPCTIPAGDGYYRSLITLEMGQPSVLIEDDTDMDLSYNVNVFDAVQPDQGRYRGHSASKVEWGHDQYGNPYPGGLNENPSDAFRDFDYTMPIYSSYITSDSATSKAIQRISAWNPWAYSTGWYWMLYNKAADSTAPVIGAFAGRASRAVGVNATGPGPQLIPGSAGKHNAGFTFQTTRRAADASTYARSRMHWGIFVGTKAEDLKDPYSIQNVNLQMNIHGGIDLTKVARYVTVFNDPPDGYGSMYITRAQLQRIADQVRADTAYYQYLYNAEPSTEGRQLLDIWRDSSGTKARTTLQEISTLAQDILDRLANRAGIYDFYYHYWMGGVVMSRKAVIINALLADSRLTAQEKDKLKSIAALFASLLWDEDYLPLSATGISLGTPGMPVQYGQYRQQYTLLLPQHPLMQPKVPEVQGVAVATIPRVINEAGASLGSPHYTGAEVEPLLNTLQQLNINGIANVFQQEPRLGKFGDFYMNMLTPPEPRFGGRRKLVSFGDGSTEGSSIFGQLGTAFAGVDAQLSARLMNAWIASDKPQSGFFATTIVKIDDTLPVGPLNLRSGTYPGYCSVLRHEADTARETAVWFINGTFYFDHRHDDGGSVSIYALKAPLAVDWGSMYSPQTPGAYTHNLVLPESAIGRPWDQDSPSLSQGASPWQNAVQDTFESFELSTRAVGSLTSTNNTKWTRSVYTLAPQPSYPVIVIADDFTGPDAQANKVFTLNQMAEGAVQTPAGSITPVARLYDNNTRKELPSASPPLSLAPGLNRFQFTGQWLIDWDLYTHSAQPQQSLIGNWGHTWHPTTEANQFQQANGRSFQESQHLLRLRGSDKFRVFLLPFLKGQARQGLTVTHDGTQMMIASPAGEQMVISDKFYAYKDSQQTVVTSFTSQTVSAFGIQISGGATEIVIKGGKVTVVAHGAAGLRQFTLPIAVPAQPPITQNNGTYNLDYQGGAPVKVVM
jgi:hypothetical protein